MGKIYHGNIELVGNTPLVEIANFSKHYDLQARLLVKLEYLNPAGSAKDRVAKQMILDAEASGALQPGGTIVEPTSGNTGIGLAAIAASRGYSVILTMPDTMSKERINILKAYGAEIILTEGSKGMSGAIEKAKEIVAERPGAYLTGQFDNPSNPKAHRLTTGPEIWEDTDGNVDIFVASVGSGGTITGVGEYLKEKKPDLQVIAVEPETSPLLSKGVAGPHAIQGIGANFVPSILNTSIYDEVFPVDNEVCFTAAKQLALLEGISTGISSGATLYAAVQIARRPENKGKTIVALLPDSGDRYYSTALFGEGK